MVEAQEKKEIVRSVRLSYSDLKEYEKLKDKVGTSVSSLLTRAVHEWLNHNSIQK